ncbi:MAG: ATP-binding cassette domain-containing protein [Anaerolineaceae bacterium]|nr:MAG: ATP-binding cassette domain-containing protein [Anaerolineaceae bacterium]
MQTLISVEDVTKNYGEFRAVDNVTFDVQGGEVFAMLGPNGAGKSTTIRMILDIIRPDSGKIYIMGEKISDKAKDIIGYLPEERGLYRDVKVIDVMVYLGTLRGLSAKAARERSMALLEKLELAENAEQKVKEFSKGMQQKVQFAVTILHEPRIIIVDEPFSGLDPVNTRLIKEMLLELRDQGTAIIMSTHQMHQVEEMADRLMMINRGRRVLYGDVADVRRQYAEHAVVVEGEGDWSTLPGVVRVRKDNNSRDGTLLYLRDDASADDVMSAIASSAVHRIDRFEVALPSLSDVFIASAGEHPEDIEREQREEAAHVG